MPETSYGHAQAAILRMYDAGCRDPERMREAALTAGRNFAKRAGRDVELCESFALRGWRDMMAKLGQHMQAVPAVVKK